ncbi:MAG: hypothetical protein WCP97_03925 [bacterium]
MPRTKEKLEHLMTKRARGLLSNDRSKTIPAIAAATESLRGQLPLLSAGHSAAVVRGNAIAQDTTALNYLNPQKLESQAEIERSKLSLCLLRDDDFFSLLLELLTLNQ